MPKSEDSSHRCQEVNKLSSITSYWTNMSKKERRPHNLTKDGIMGEISASGLPVLLRFFISTISNIFEPMISRWRASLWKSVWKQLLCYLFTFLAISLIYRSWTNYISRSSLILSYHRVILADHSRITFEWVTPIHKKFSQIRLHNPGC